MSNLNIIFDYDGTLHESINIYAPAFRKAYSYLLKKGYVEKRAYSNEEISYWLGYSSKDMWNDFMPDLPEDEKLICSNIIGNEMIKNIIDNKGNLYNGVTDILHKLKVRGYNLIFFSNCKTRYMNTHIEKFNLDRYFEAFYCTEEFNYAPKFEIFNAIKEKYNGDFLVIGDRFQDIEIAMKHNVKSVACLYGYGQEAELVDADFKINDIIELKQIIDAMSYDTI